jgi:hypothetical protein
MKPNSIPSVGTEDATSTTADVSTSSQTIAKPNVIRGCQHELVLIEGKKEWFCWLCKKYEKELNGNLV